ncbi:peptide ABC transporter substrate-binding protein [Desulfosediminicola flagellatus]|uniref:peptide ABC transporter substrate-binding protein n=1 Tax=Desulfosediminicola flagellatus TaxID=2569541 RepID=UPI001C3D2630|nr:peptide ABC transporter substrate-binding protein [Desulfosediminicola flagellatus]
MKGKLWRNMSGLRNVFYATCVFALMTAGTAYAGGTLRVAAMGEPASLDPHKVSGTWENYIVGDMFLGLTTEDPKAEAVPGVAESWTISEDLTTYTFKLRKSTWSDGTPLTANDFVFSLQRILLPETAAEYASLLYVIDGAEAVNSGKAEASSLGVKALDDYTLEIKLVGPAPYFLDLLTHYTAYPVPKHVIDKVGKDWTKPENMVVNGPFKLVEWLPNTHVKLTKNDNYYDVAAIDLDALTFFTQEDRAAVQKRFRAGEIDVAMDFSSDQIGWLRENMPEETRIAPYMGVYYYPINSSVEPFTDVRVRTALSMAVNREAIVDKVLKTGELAAYSFVPPGVSHYSKPAEVEWKDVPYGERVKKAKALLADAGFTADNPLELTLRYNTSENHKRIAVAVVSMWKAIGVKAELHNAEVKVHYADLKQGDFQVARAGWIADYNDAQNFLYLLETRTGANNYGRYSNPEFDSLMKQAEVTADLKKRGELMYKAEAQAMADMPVIPIYHYVSKNLVSKKVVGFEDNAKDIHRWRYITLK